MVRYANTEAPHIGKALINACVPKTIIFSALMQIQRKILAIAAGMGRALHSARW